MQQKYKTIRETRKENPIEYIMLGNLDCTFDPEKDNYDPKKTVSVLACKYTSICRFRKYTYWCLAPLNFAYVSIFCKKLALLKAIVWELCYKLFSSVFSFCKTKGYYYCKHNFCRLLVRNPASGLLQISQKSKKWQWRQNFPTRSTSNFFDVVLFLLSILVTGPSFMAMSSLVLEL